MVSASPPVAAARVSRTGPPLEGGDDGGEEVAIHGIHLFGITGKG